jgi:hypothetical protein
MTTDEQIVRLKAESFALQTVLCQIVVCMATAVAGNGELSASEFVRTLKRESETLLLADGFADGDPRLEILRADAITALGRFCDPIAASLEKHQQRSPGTAETSKDEPT